MPTIESKSFCLRLSVCGSGRRGVIFCCRCFSGWLVGSQRSRMLQHDVIRPTYASSIIFRCNSSLSLLWGRGVSCCAGRCSWDGMVTERTVVATCAHTFCIEFARPVVVPRAFVTGFVFPNQLVLAKPGRICDDALCRGGRCTAVSALVLHMPTMEIGRAS